MSKVVNNKYNIFIKYSLQNINNNYIIMPYANIDYFFVDEYYNYIHNFQ